MKKITCINLSEKLKEELSKYPELNVSGLCESLLTEYLEQYRKFQIIKSAVREGKFKIL